MWRRLLGSLNPYARVQLFREKIKIEKLHEQTQETMNSYRGRMPEGMVRAATFCINPYHIYFDVFEDDKGGKIFIVENLTEGAEQMLREWFQVKDTCEFRNEKRCGETHSFCNRQICPKLRRVKP